MVAEPLGNFGGLTTGLDLFNFWAQMRQAIPRMLECLEWLYTLGISKLMGSARRLVFKSRRVGSQSLGWDRIRRFLATKDIATVFFLKSFQTLGVYD